MNDQAKLIAKTVLDTIYALGPAIIASGIAKNPRAVSLVELLPVIMEIFQTAQNAVAAGSMTEEELNELFKGVGMSIQSSHDKWAAMDQKAQG